jgi:poly(beta-D-mannuronate) lyase
MNRITYIPCYRLNGWFWGVVLGVLVLPPFAYADPLVAPSGFYAKVQHRKQAVRDCPPVVPPYTKTLAFPSKYEGSDSERDEINPKSHADYKAQTADINELEKNVSSLVDDYFHGGHTETRHCVLQWMTRWSRANALESAATTHTGKAVRKWVLASLASSYLRLKFSVSRPLQGELQKANQIEGWLSDLANIVVSEWKDQPMEKMNNHEYWAAWAVMATAVVLDRQDLFAWSMKQYDIAMEQVDAEGYLPNELTRGTRAFSYHNYSLLPLTMIAAFANANQVKTSPQGEADFHRLAIRVIANLDHPGDFEKKTGRKQNVSDMQEKSKWAWLEPYCRMFSCEEALLKRIVSLRPIKSYRLGGNVTLLFSDP